MNNAASIERELRRRLADVRAHQYRTDARAGAMMVAAAAVAAASLLLLAEALFAFSAAFRTTAVVFFVLGLIGSCGWFAGRPLLRLLGLFPSQSDEDVARRAGNFFPDVQDRLLNALQLSISTAHEAQRYSEELTSISLNEFIASVRDVDFSQSVPTAHLAVYRNRLLLCTAVPVLLFLFFPSSFIGAANRFAQCRTEFTPPPEYQFQISPGSKEIVKGESVDVRVTVIPRRPALYARPAEIIVVRHPEGQERADELHVKPDSSGAYSVPFASVRFTTTYFAKIADVESDHDTLTVVDRPLIRSFHVQLDYPAYTKLAAKQLDEWSGDVFALAGTRVFVSGAASKPLRAASLLFGNSTNQPLTVRDEKFSGSFSVRADNSYWITVTDNEGLANSDPVRYQVHVVQDAPPTIAIVDPGRNLDIAGDQPLNLRMQARDDFGFSSLRIGYRFVKSRYTPTSADYTYIPVPLAPASGGEMDVSYVWNLAGLNLVPEDAVEYFAEVFDNDAVTGPKSGRSALYTLRLPSLDEVFADVDKQHEESLDDLKQSLEEAQKLRQDVESIQRDLKNNKDPDWQTKKKLETMAKRYEDIQKKLQSTSERVEHLTEQLQQQNVLSKETLEKYLELQQLMQQIDPTELQRMLNQLQQTPTISKEQLQQAMQTMQFSEERFRQSIERTMNLLKRLQIEQKTDELKKRADALTKAENQLREESSKSSSTAEQQQDLAKKQSDLVQQEQAMEREGQELQRKMEEFFNEMPADKLQSALQQLQQQQVGQHMQQASRQMQSGNMQSAQQMQQQAAQQLQEFSQRMSAMQQQMLQKQAQHVMNELRKASSDILELSKKEEALKHEAQNAPEGSSQLRQNAEDQQQAMQDLQNVMKGMADLSQQSFAVTREMEKAMNDALAKMQSAMRSLDSRSGNAASQDEGQAMAALNKGAMQIQSALQSLMQGGGAGAGSLMQQLQMLAGQQAAINAQTQQMGGMSPQQAAEAARLAQQQAAVQKSLEELSCESQQSAERQRLLGDLNKIEDEMKEVVRNLEQNHVGNETVNKQQRILSRLLDASKSMNERDYEKKRKSERGEAAARRSPAELNLEEKQNRLREELLKALEQGYAKDYQELIRKYFEQLEKTEKSVY